MKSRFKKAIGDLLWRTARLDGRERWWWNTLNHRVLGGTSHRAKRARSAT